MLPCHLPFLCPYQFLHTISCQSFQSHSLPSLYLETLNPNLSSTNPNSCHLSMLPLLTLWIDFQVQQALQSLALHLSAHAEFLRIHTSETSCKQGGKSVLERKTQRVYPHQLIFPVILQADLGPFSFQSTDTNYNYSGSDIWVKMRKDGSGIKKTDIGMEGFRERMLFLFMYN